MAESKSTKSSSTSTTKESRDGAAEEALRTVKASQSDPERPVARKGLAGDGVMATSLEEKGTDRGEPQEDTTVNEDNEVLRNGRENDQRVREVNEVSAADTANDAKTAKK